MKLKLQVVLIPVNQAEIPTLGILSYKKFLHLTDPVSTVGEVCDALIERYNKLYPEADKLQIEGVQDNNTCDLDPDFAAGDVFLSGDIVRVLVDNLLPSYSRETSTILPDSTTGDISNISRKRGDVSELNDSRLMKKSRTIWGIRQESPAAEDGSTFSNAAATAENSINKSPVSLPPPPEQQTPSSKIIPQKKASPASNSGKRITSGMLQMPAEQQADERNTENNGTKVSPADAACQSPEVDEIDDGTESDDLVSNRLLKHTRKSEITQKSNTSTAAPVHATKLDPPPPVLGKTPSKKEPLNTLTPYNNRQAPQQPVSNAVSSQIPNVTKNINTLPSEARQNRLLNSSQAQTYQQNSPQSNAVPFAPSTSYPFRQVPNQPSQHLTHIYGYPTNLVGQPPYAVQQPQSLANDSNLHHNNNVPPKLAQEYPARHLMSYTPGEQPPQQKADLGPYKQGLDPQQAPTNHPTLSNHISNQQSTRLTQAQTTGDRHLSHLPGVQGQTHLKNPQISQSKGISVASSQDTLQPLPVINKAYYVTSPVENQKMQESFKRQVDRVVDDAVKQQELLKQQGDAAIKEVEQKVAEESRRKEEKRRVEEEMKKAEANRILQPAEELRRLIELSVSEQELRDKKLLIQKKLEQRHELAREQEALRQKELELDAALRKQDDLRRQAELKKQVELRQEEALRQQEQTKEQFRKQKEASEAAPSNTISTAQPSDQAGTSLIPSDATVRPASSLGGLTPTVAVLPRPDEPPAESNGSTQTSAPQKRQEEHVENIDKTGRSKEHHDGPSLTKDEVLSLFKNNSMRVPSRITKKLAPSQPDTANFLAREEEHKRKIREENIARNAAEIESRRRSATAAVATTSRSLRSRVTIGGVPNFENNLDNLEDEKEKEKEKLKEIRANNLPSPFKSFASKSKLSSIYVKMKKLDAKITSQHKVQTQAVKSEPTTPKLLRTADPTSDDTNESSPSKAAAADNDSSVQNSDERSSEQSDENFLGEEGQEKSKIRDNQIDDERSELSQSEEGEEEEDVELQDAAAASDSSPDVVIDSSVGHDSSASENETPAYSRSEKRKPSNSGARKAARVVDLEDENSISQPIKRPRGRPRRSLRKSPVQPRSSLRTRSSGPEVIDLDSSSESGSEEENSGDLIANSNEKNIEVENDLTLSSSSSSSDEESSSSGQEESAKDDAGESNETSKLPETASKDHEGKKDNTASYENTDKEDEETAEDTHDESKISLNAPIGEANEGNESHQRSLSEYASASSKSASPERIQEQAHGSQKGKSSEESSENLKLEGSNAKDEDEQLLKSSSEEMIVEESKLTDAVTRDGTSDSDEANTDQEQESSKQSSIPRNPPIEEEQSTPIAKVTSSKKGKVDTLMLVNALTKLPRQTIKNPKSTDDTTKALPPKRSAPEEVDEPKTKKLKLALIHRDPAKMKEGKSPEPGSSVVDASSTSGSSSSASSSESSEPSSSESSSSESTSSSEESDDEDEDKEEKEKDAVEDQVVRSTKDEKSKDSKDSSSDSSSDSDSESESGNEADKKPTPVTKASKPALVSLVSSRMLKKKFGSLTKPTTKPMKAPSPPVHRHDEGVRTITIDTPFSKSSDEDEKKAKAKTKSPASSATKLTKLNSLDDLQKRGLPDVRDAKFSAEEKSSVKMGSSSNKNDSGRSSENSGSDSSGDSDSDSALSSDEKEEEQDTKFATQKSLARDAEVKKKKKKKDDGFELMMRHAPKA